MDGPVTVKDMGPEFRNHLKDLSGIGDLSTREMTLENGIGLPETDHRRLKFITERLRLGLDVRFRDLGGTRGRCTSRAH